MLGRASSEAHVPDAGLPGVLLRGCDRLTVGINPIYLFRKSRDAEGQAAVATPEVEDTFAAHKRRPTPRCELNVWPRPQSR